MTTTIIFLLIWTIVSRVGLYGIFEKSGEKGWKAFVPVLGALTWLDIIGRERKRYLLLLVPLVNFFVWAGMCIQMANSFKRESFLDHFFSFVANPLYFLKLGFDKNERYRGKGWEMIQANPIVKEKGREWTEAIIFAVFAASFIRMFLIEAYTIPTSSMESSLKVGDFLFVSKAHYGIRTPNTPIQFPLVHNMLPASKIESYLKWIQWDNYRLPALQKIKRYDPVVFNFPEGDTIAWLKDPTMKKTQGRNYYYAYKRMFGEEKVKENFDLTYRPIDKRDNYIKRCVGLPGDTISIKNKILYVGKSPAENPKNIQYGYDVVMDKGVTRSSKEGVATVSERWFDKFVIEKKMNQENFFTNGYNQDGTVTFQVNMTQEQLAYMSTLKAEGIVKTITPSTSIVNEATLFPHDTMHYNGWTKNDFGPLWVPSRGATIKISTKNIAPYQRIISVYEGHDLQIKGQDIFIDGVKKDSYTFEMDYYWMMGDNRDGSEDSRYFGFVPEDHIVGKPLFIWMSKGPEGIRFNRIFTGCNKMN